MPRASVLQISAVSRSLRRAQGQRQQRHCTAATLWTDITFPVFRYLQAGPLRRSRKPYRTCKNVSLPCTELKYVQFHVFLSKFGCYGNAVWFIENSDSILLFEDPKTLLFTVKISLLLAQNWNQCNFGRFLLKFGCHGSSFWSLKSSDNICEFTDS